MLLPNRHDETHRYRYGFQGQEMDDEVKGEGNSVNYKFRMHDPRVGRFFAVDPLTSKYPHYTPYSFSGNKVIAYIELEGLEEKSVKETTYTSKVESETISEQRHVVKAGDNITQLGKTYGVTNGQIRVANPKTQNRQHKDQINVGEALIIPLHESYNLFATKITTIDGEVSGISEEFDIPSNSKTPYDVGKNWLSGKGERHDLFSNGDGFTKLLQSHYHIEFTRRKIRNIVSDGGSLEGSNPFSLGGWQGKKYLGDALAIIGLGENSNLAVAYLGSFNLKYSIFNINKKSRSAAVVFSVTNSSNMNSATHPIGIGYTEWWSENVGDPLNESFKEGWGSETKQTFIWVETITY